MNRHPETRRLTRILLAALLLPVTVLAAPQMYDVEVIVFSNRTSGDDGEHWPTTLREGAVLPEFIDSSAITELPSSTWQLGGIAYGLGKSRGYEVLLHTAWRQPAMDSNNAVMYPLDMLVENGNKRLAGHFTLIRERYLHLDVDLLLTSPGAAVSSAYLEAPVGSPVYELMEKRRIKKSGKLHYFDHPRFGVIAMVTPWVSPEQQQQQVEAEERARVEAEAAAAEAAAAEPDPNDNQLTR